LKNTAFRGPIEAALPFEHGQTSDKWKAVPFLILMFASGLPLNYDLAESRPMTVADVAGLTSDATAMSNSGSSILFVFFLAGLYALSGIMLMHRPKTVIAMFRRQWPLACLMILVASSVLWSMRPEKTMLSAVHLFGILLIATAAALHYRHDPWSLPKHLSYLLGINMVLQVGAALSMPSYAIDWQGRWQGLTSHPNTLGALAYTTLWANCVMLICRRPGSPYPHVAFALLAAVAMLEANSVTSIVTTLCCLLGIVVMAKLAGLGVRRKFFVGLLIIAGATILITCLIASQFDMGWVLESFGRDSNFTGRTSVWEDALSAISRRPLLGWSFDDHAFLIETENMPYPTYHNGWLDLCVSGGLVSIILFLSLIATWAGAFFRRGGVAAAMMPFSIPFVIGYMVHNLTEASLLAARGQMWQIFLVLVLLGSCRSAPDALRTMRLRASGAGIQYRNDVDP